MPNVGYRMDKQKNDGCTGDFLFFFFSFAYFVRDRRVGVRLINCLSRRNVFLSLCFVTFICMLMLVDRVKFKDNRVNSIFIYTHAHSLLFSTLSHECSSRRTNWQPDEYNAALFIRFIGYSRVHGYGHRVSLWQHWRKTRMHVSKAVRVLMLFDNARRAQL